MLNEQHEHSKLWKCAESLSVLGLYMYRHAVAMNV